MQCRRWAGLGLFLCLGIACKSRSVPMAVGAPSPDAALPVDVLEADAAAPEPMDAPDETDPRATRTAGPFAGFAVPKDARLGRVIGFSADDAYLGYEFSSCDPCPQEYDFASPKKPPLRFGYLWDPSHADQPGYEARRKKHDDAVDAKRKQLSPDTYDPPFTLRGPFPYPDLAFAYKVERDDAKGTVLVHMGLRVQGEDPVLPIELVLGPHPMRKPRAEDVRTWARLPKDEREKALREYEENFVVWEPDAVYMNVTKDGSEIGCAAVTHGSMWIDVMDRARTDTKKLVSRVYNETGLRHHKANEHLKASVYFARAAEVSPTTSLFHYNAACAYARAGDAKAEESLRTAIKLGGASVRARAAKDEDFASVRTAAWFKTL